MKKIENIVYLVLLLTINLSCVEVKSTASTIATTESKSSSFFINTSDDTLIYTSGIRCVLHDSQGNYWIGSHQEGVARFDGEHFKYFTVEDGLSNNQVRTIQEDDEGVIWFGTGNGVSSFSEDRIVRHELNETQTGIPGPRNSEGKTTNDLWFNVENRAGFSRFNGGELKFEAFPVEIGKKPYDPFAYCVTGFSKTRSDYGWIATYSAVFGYDGEDFKRIDEDFIGITQEKGHLHIRSILEDSKGNLWIGNNGIGVLLYDGERVINFSLSKGLIHAESGGSGGKSPEGTLEHVFAISEDNEGNIWFGDRDTGAWRYDGEVMTNFTVDPNLSGKHIWQIYQDTNGELLFSMQSGGVYVFNGTSFERKF